jgi:hypothetical protein
MYFPFKLHTDLIDLFANNRDIFNIITYDDFLWDKDEPCCLNYPSEKDRWERYLKKNIAERYKIHVLIQHDVDASPENTMNLIKYEKDKNIKSNIMIFNRKTIRTNDPNNVLYGDYELDFDLLKECEKNGFIIGYHCNAYERSKYNLNEAKEIFTNDINELSKKFKIKYFSAHGGQWNFDRTLNNKNIEVPDELKSKLIWVHNGAAPFFNKTFSDGGIRSYYHVDQNKRDLRQFIGSMRFGDRCRILTHPQYYSEHFKELELLLKSSWYRPVLDSYRKNQSEISWLETKKYINVLKSIVNRNNFRGKCIYFLRIVNNKFYNNFINIHLKIKKKLSLLKKDLIFNYKNYKLNSLDKPIFVRGMSRSGGTLLTTLLDSHPKISMSYELYPDLLDINLNKSKLIDLGKQIKDSVNRKKALSINSDLKVFLARAERGGLNYKTVGNLLNKIAGNFNNDVKLNKNNIYEIISALCKKKLYSEKKQFWGMKCNGDYDAYLSIWPRAKFINIVRDGRDVLSSQKNTGKFNPDAQSLGNSWSKVHMHFRNLALTRPKNFLQVKYEELVNNPEYELRRITGFLGLTFSKEMLNHNKNSLTLFNSHHLSMDKVKLPININQIGRWKKDLSRNEIKKFSDESAKALLEFGYLKNADRPN